MGKKIPDNVLVTARALAAHAVNVKKRGDYWPRMAEELARFFKCERVTLFQKAGDGRFISRYADGVDMPIVVDAKEGLAGHAAATLKACFTNDPYKDKRFSPRVDKLAGRKTRSILAYPLLAHSEVAGIVELIDKPGGFTDLDLEAIELLAPQLTASLALVSVEERQERLEGQMRQIERLAGVGRMVAGFTHEVRAPLSIIIGFAETMAEAARDPKTAENLSRIRRNAQRIEALVKNLLGVSRVSKASVGPVDLAAAMDAAVEVATLEGRWSATKIVREFSKEIPQVTGEGGRVMQVFLNVINNALQAMEGRKGSRLKLRLRLASDRRGVVAEISDNGPGMSAELLSMIFEPFFTTKGGKGSGLGLFLVAEVMESHGGKVRVESTVGRGTTVSLVFPLTGE